MRIQHTFSLLIIPLIVVPLLLLGWNAYQHLHVSSQTKTFASLDGSLDQLTRAFEREFHQAKTNLDLLATDLIVTQYALTEDERSRYSIYQRGVLERFKNYQLAYRQYLEIRFLLVDGYEDAYWGSEDVDNISDEEGGTSWFKALQASHDDYYYTIVHSPDMGAPVFYMFKPLYLTNLAISGENTRPTLRGYLGLTVSFSALNEQLNTIADRNDLLIALIDHNVKNTQESTNDTVIVSRGLSASETTDIQAYLKAVDKLNSNNAIVELSLEAVQHHVGSRHIFGDLTLFGAVPSAKISMLSQQLSTNIFTITFGAILLTVSMIILFIRRVVVSPLDKLTLASQEIGEGKLDTQIKIKGSDEIQALASSFNRMSKELEESNNKISFIAYHDSLTQLPNRRMFQYYLQNALATAKRTKDPLALFFLDVDNFKTINDSLGHDMGDELLKLVASRINQSLRDEDLLTEPESHSEGDLVARLGGDEFTVILPRIKDALSASVVAERIIKNMLPCFSVNDQEFRIGLSIGITMYPCDGDIADDLLKFADIAMYHAKSEGKGNFQFYTANLNTEIANRIERENELRKAISSGQMFLHYQPQIDIYSNEIYGVEALVRWLHPEKGIIPPCEFIPLAEETGMILDIGNFVLNESCRQAMKWRQRGLLELKMSVNFSSVQFARQNVGTLVEDALEASGLPPEWLTVELTETSLMEAKQETLRTLEQIRDLGVTIALDDFGTGYSSLSYLRNFPVDTLKIDRSFIVEAEENEDVKEIIKAIVQMAQALRLNVVAEGVEAFDQVSFLKVIGCDIVQGYYFSKPLEADDFEHFAHHWVNTNANTTSPIEIQSVTL